MTRPYLPSPTTANCWRNRYWVQTRGHSLAERVAQLLTAYPDVSAPSFISWEGEQLTGADTTEKLRALSNALLEIPR